MKKKILISSQIPHEGLKGLDNKFHLSYYNKINSCGIIEGTQIQDYEGMITLFSDQIPQELIAKAAKMKIISNYGVGINNIPVETATRYKILLTNTPDVVTEPTAELALGLMLSLVRRISELDRKLRKENLTWGLMDNLGSNLYGKTLGIVGFGKIGKATARRARAMGMKLQYYSRTRQTDEVEKEYQVEYKAFRDLLLQADVLSLHVPYTEETHHLIGGDQLALMKPDSVLINTSRGAVIDENELIHALSNKLIAGAGLDVYENEPNIPAGFLEMDQVVLVPHIGTASKQTRIEMAVAASKSIEDFFSGNKPKNIVNQEVWNSIN